MSPESGWTGKPRIALTGDSDVLIRVLNEQYIFINYVIISIILMYLCELFQSKRLVLTVLRLPELNIENLWHYRDDGHPHTGVILLNNDLSFMKINNLTVIDRSVSLISGCKFVLF